MPDVKIIKPPNKIRLDKPVVFLAGPIQGASIWQDKAIELLTRHATKDLIIANPRRDSLTDENFVYDEQVNWEREHLKKAGNGIPSGCVIFWLCNEAERFDNRSYAQTTRYELAEWITRHQFTDANLVIGIDDNFSGAKYIRHRLKDTPRIGLFDSLEDTVLAALKHI